MVQTIEEEQGIYCIEGVLLVFEPALTFSKKQYYKVKIDNIILSWWNISDAENCDATIGDVVLCYYTLKKGYKNINSMFRKDYTQMPEAPVHILKFVEENLFQQFSK